MKTTPIPAPISRAKARITTVAVSIVSLLTAFAEVSVPFATVYTGNPKRPGPLVLKTGDRLCIKLSEGILWLKTDDTKLEKGDKKQSYSCKIQYSLIEDEKVTTGTYIGSLKYRLHMTNEGRENWLIDEGTQDFKVAGVHYRWSLGSTDGSVADDKLVLFVPNGTKYAIISEAAPVEQGGTGQPATRPESKSEGSGKPQPEAEGRSR